MTAVTPLDRCRASRRTAAARRGRTLVAAVALLVALGAVLALPASAHVTVGSDEVHQGASDALLTFRVPNERSGTTTVKVTVTFPGRTPLASVTPQAKPGWTVTTRTVTFARPISTDDGDVTKGIGEITWTASVPAAAVQPDRFDTFQVLAGPLPKGVDTLAFPTVQTYANGQTSAWVEPAPPGSEPEHPAPVLHLLPAGDSSSPSATGPATAADTGPGVSARSPRTDTAGGTTADTARTARTLGVAGLAVGVVGLAVGGLALFRGRRTAPSGPRGPSAEG